MTHVSAIMGNRCGHRAKSPRLYQPEQRSVISILEIAQNNCETFYHKYDRSSYLDSLILSRTSARKIRSEGRERTLVILQILLQYCDLASLRVGVPNKDGAFWSPSLRWLAEKAGFRQKGDPESLGIKRAWRAIKDLVDAGYLEVHQRFLRLEGEHYKGLAAIKKISKKLFLELGISKLRLDNHRKTASKRLQRQRIEETNKRSLAKVQFTMDKLTQHKQRQQKKRHQEVRRQQQRDQHAIHHEKQLIQLALSKAKAEGRSPTEVLLELRQS